MKRLPSVPGLREGASFTELVRRVAALHQLSETKATYALGFDDWSVGGPSTFDARGFTPQQVRHLRLTTGMDTECIAALTLPAAFPAFCRLRKSDNQDAANRKSWERMSCESRGIHLTEAPACVLCLAEDPLKFPLVWRFSLLPVCTRHEVYLSPPCPRCKRLPGRAARTRKNYENYCRGACIRTDPQKADEPVIAAQTRLRNLMTDETTDDGVLRVTLDFAWYLRHQGRGTRAKSEAPNPKELGRILMLATEWSTRDPEDVAAQPDFLQVPAQRLQPRRPFASASLRTAFYSRSRTRAQDPSPPSIRPNITRVKDPRYLPLDLHIRYTSDLIHDGWTRKTPPKIRTTRLIAAKAVTSRPNQWRSAGVAAVARRLEERGQLEKWLTALADVRTELAQNPRLFGATWEDVDIFAANFRQDSEASYPIDAAIIWFLRDHRCVNYADKLGWTVTRRKSASATERIARRSGTCGPWDEIEERLAHAAATADRHQQPHAQTA